MLLSYKPLHLEAQQRLQEEGCVVDIKTQSGNEHEPSDNVNDDVHVNAQPSNDNDVEIEPVVDLDNPQSKNQRYDKRDFVARSSETHALSS